MILTIVTCGVTIYDRKIKQVRTCGAVGRWQIVVFGDSLFTVCERHKNRLKKAKLA